MERLRNLSDLSNYSFTEKDINETQSPEKSSQKPIDVFSRELLAKYPELETRITETIKEMVAQKKLLPLIHFTSDKIRKSDGSEVSTGFVENIVNNGFRARDTNVGGFIGKKNLLGDPSQFDKAELLVKAYKKILDKYLHHGIRTNKAVLQNMEKGMGLPVMIVVNGDLPVEPGTDYDNHFILKNQSHTDDIIKIISMHGRKSSQIDDVALSLSELLDAM